MQSDKLESARKELIDEQRRLTGLRNDYARIMRSRFHALRLLWFSFKEVLGIASNRDIYAAWSASLAPPSLASIQAREHNASSGRELHDAKTAELIEVWAARSAANPLSQDPTVSVVIPACNHVAVTAGCLRSIADTWFESLKVQIIVVDDASFDETFELAAALPGLECVRNGANVGFVRSCNRGAALARGKYICFLNNDTIVKDGWLDYLVSRAESEENIGIVGPKLLYPDGTLQEAGGIIWRDGTGWNYGRNDDPKDPRFNYVRDVDYCSGAVLLVRTSLFRMIGGFSEAFVPAYYEDVDICFAARSFGYRVVFEPRAEVVHLEGVSSGTNTSEGIKRFQNVNLPKFREKWRAVLDAHAAGDSKAVPEAARRLRAGRVVLMIDDYVPLHDKEAGSKRLFEIIKILRSGGYHVVFLPDNYAPLQPYTAELQALGVEVLHHIERGRTMDESLAEVLPLIDLAWICRPQLFHKYAPRVRRNHAAKIVYDTIDLHFMRKKREADLFGYGDSDWQAMEKSEIAAARSADATLVVTPQEQETLVSYKIPNVGVIPTLHDMKVAQPREFQETDGILFIGSYNHTPNVDAVQWLCKEIMPLVWERLPNVKVTLLGNNPPQSVLDLQSPSVRVTGYVPDVEPHFLSSRVFVAPLRYGAGHKGKIGHSLSYGLPVVTTTIGSEGFGLTNGVNFLLADNERDFAVAIVRLYTERDLWRRISAGSTLAVEPFSSVAIRPKLLALLSDLLSEPAQEISV